MKLRKSQKYANHVEQVGNNPDFPKDGELWDPSQPVPEWLSDNAKILEVTDSGKMILDTRTTNTGETQILDSRGNGQVLVTYSEGIIRKGNTIKGVNRKELYYIYGRGDCGRNL